MKACSAKMLACKIGLLMVKEAADKSARKSLITLNRQLLFHFLKKTFYFIANLCV